MNIKIKVLASVIIMAFAAAADPVEYLDPVYKTAGVPTSGIDHWVTNSVDTYESVLNDSEDEVTWTNGWYVVTNDVTIAGRIACKGDVHLILSDGVTLTAPKGITVNCLENVKNSLAIYGQAEGTGRLLIEKPRERAAGLGGDYCDHGENITINGGVIKVRGGEGAAAIGGGYGDGNNITINGGNVWAIGGLSAAAIGGSFTGVAKNLTINGGTVRVSGGDDSALIGGGIRMGVAFSTGIVISSEANVIFDLDGVIEDLGSPRGLTIVTPRNPQDRPLMGRIEAWTGAESLTVTNAYTHETGTLTVGGGKKWFTNRNLELLAPTAENSYLRFAVSDAAIDYLYPDYNTPGDPTSGIRSWMGSMRRGGTYRSVRNAVKGDTWTNGWYVVEQDDVVIDTNVQCNGDVHLILCDGAKLTVNGSIVVNSEYAHLTVYGQKYNSGCLTVTKSTGGYAAIGGGYGRAGGNITINGGRILADGTTQAAAIGGGAGGMGTNIVINGGWVWARNRVPGTGTAIGGAHGQRGIGITINGGNVHACAHYEGDIIGSGLGAEVSKSVRISPEAQLILDGRYAPTQTEFVTGGRPKLLLDEPKTKDLVGGLVSQTGFEKIDVSIGSGHEPVEMTLNGHSVEFGGERWRLGRGEHTGRLRFARARQTTGIFVSGREVGEGQKIHGWTYADGVLTVGEWESGWVLSGTNTEGDVRIVVDANLVGLTLDHLTLIYTNGVNAITLTHYAANTAIHLRGTNTIYGQSPANDTYAAICLDQNAWLRVYDDGNGVLRGGYDGGGQGTDRPGSNYRGIWLREGKDSYGYSTMLEWHGGTLSSYAATIGQTGGGIAAAKYATVEIYDGTITNCYSNAGGGAIGLREGGCFFRMDGGRIVDCHAGDGKDRGTPSDIIHNHRANAPVEIRGGAFDVHPISHSFNVVLGEHRTVRPHNGLLIVSYPYYYAPKYKVEDVPQSGIDHWITNALSISDWRYVGDRTGEVTWENGWYMVEKDAVRNGRITCNGDVHLVIADDATLTLNGGFRVPPGKILRIYGQHKGTGTLVIRDVAEGCAGIGGNRDEACGKIFLNGGMLDVFSGRQSAGIGGGENGVGANITINGGRVFANSLNAGAGIGGGEGGTASNIVVNAGTVMAVAGGGKAAAIGGGGEGAAAENITINGGSVRASAFGANSFIGGGLGGACKDVRIAREATLVFSFFSSFDALKWDYPTSTIVLPKENIYASRSLVDCAGVWEGPKTFVLTNVATHATADITVGGGKLAFEGRDFVLPTPAAQDSLDLLITSHPVTYLKPVYNTPGDPKSGIDRWVTDTAESPLFVAPSLSDVILKSGWYVVLENVAIGGRILCEGDVHLIVKDGVTLTVAGGITCAGEKNHLTVYAQEKGTGQLLSVSKKLSAAGIDGNVTINGGIVTAFGCGNATAIGGAGANVILNRGTILPVIANDRAFIEGATLVNDEAKIVFSLTGRKVETLEGIANTTILVSDYPTPRTLIDGPCSCTGAAKNWTVSCPATGEKAVFSPGGEAVTCGHRGLMLTGAGTPACTLQVFGVPTLYRLPVYNTPGDPASGIARWEETIHGSAGMRILNMETGHVWTAGWYVLESDLTIDGRVTCEGDVHLILPDGMTLTVNGGISVSYQQNHLTIYAQEKGTGRLVSRATAERQAGIGGVGDFGGRNVTINGGMIEAYGEEFAAGIGGGCGCVGASIVINGGTVRAQGGYHGAAIGGGEHGVGENIVVNGGYVMAEGGIGAAAVGGGCWGNCDGITLNRGTVVATVPKRDTRRLMFVYTDSLIGRGWEVIELSKNIRISKDMVLVYDLCHEPEKVFTKTYDRSTILTQDVDGKEFAEKGVVPGGKGNWTGPETFLVTHVDTHETVEMQVNGPSVDFSGKKCHVSYKSDYGSLALCPASHRTGVYVNGVEVDAEAQGEGWTYNGNEKAVKIEREGTYRITGRNIYGDVHFVFNCAANLILDNLTLIYPNGDDAFIVSPGVKGAKATLVGKNTIYGKPPIQASEEDDVRYDAVFRVENNADLMVTDAGRGNCKDLLVGDMHPRYYASKVEAGGQLSWNGGTVSNYFASCLNRAEDGAALCRGGIFDRSPIIMTHSFVIEKHCKMTQVGDLYYVYSHLYETPVYNTPGDPTSGIARWETNMLDRTQCETINVSHCVAEWKSGWYVVESDCIFLDGIIYSGDVHLLLASGATMTLNGMGLATESPDAKLTIYGECRKDNYPTGTLECRNLGEGYSGIGGGKGFPGNNITINGGTIWSEARGNAAAIGGGRGGAATNVVVNGGLLYLAADTDAAVIGGSASNNAFGITINGGTITDYSSKGSAGIGCGRGCKEVWPAGNTNLVVNGGSINASVGDDIHKTGTTLYRVVDTNNIPDVGPLEITGLGDYDVHNIYPALQEEGLYQLTFYLPNPSGSYWVNGVCHAYTNGVPVIAKPYSPTDSASFATEEAARAAAATAYVRRPNKDVEGVISPADYNAMFKFIFRESANTTWSVEPVLKDEVIKDVTETIENKDVTALLAASVTTDTPATEVKTRAGLYYGIGGSTDVKDVGTVPTWLLGDGKIQTLEGAKPAAATDKAFYRIRVTPTP